MESYSGIKDYLKRCMDPPARSALAAAQAERTNGIHKGWRKKARKTELEKTNR